MKKTALFLAAILLLSVLAFASCGPKESPGCHHVDRNSDLVCDLCDEALKATETPICDHANKNKDHECDKCGATITGCVDTDNHYCDVCGKSMSTCVDNNKDHLCDVCVNILSEHEDNDDHLCDYCGFIVSNCADKNSDHKCDLCGKEVTKCDDKDSDHACDTCTKVLSECADSDDEGYECDVCGKVLFEEVSYSLNVSDIDAGTRSADDIHGMFTIVSGTEVRNRTKTYEGIEYSKSIKIGGNAHKVKINVPGPGTLSFIIQNGSSGADMQWTKVIAPDGTVTDIEFMGNAGSSPLVLLTVEVTEGEWRIERGKNSGTQDIFYLQLDCVVEVSEESGFELVTPGNVDFLVGDTLTTSGVRLNAKFENGKLESLPLEKVTFDTSKVDMTKSGTYEITISYKDYDPITYSVNVYAPESIKLGFDAIEKLAQNSSAGNGVYFNHSFKELYFKGEALDTTGLSVIVVAKCGDKSLEFKVENYEITGFDSETKGEKTLTITANGVSATTFVYVADVEITPDEDGVIQALVDPEYLGPRGDLSGPFHVFNTIQQALDFLAHADAATPKVISIAPGLYKEKLEITIPNLTIVGAGAKPEDVVIEWDSLYGLVDAGGFTHTTDSTATVAVREQAINCVIENLTISNYWNSQERMTEAGLGIERGLALLVMADRFIMRDSRLLGIQDTLELFTGRQYFENTFISGYTDFIFGTNNTTYFKNCTIHVIDTEKDDKGTAGYLTAFKGSNKGEGDAITYGAIFDGCKFTADEGVMEGCTAIGRPWGAYAAVAIINSEIGGHISVKGYETSKNERYVSMNAKPTDATVQYVEYNNTGAGAITEAVAGMRMLTEEEAAKYADFAVIFGTTNNKVTYLDPWDPSSDEVVVDDRIYYNFNGQEGTSGTWYIYDQELNGTTGTFIDIAIDATAGKVTARNADTQINAGAKLTFSVEAGTIVTVVTHSGYGNYTLNGIATDASTTFSQYYAEATTVVFEATATMYLHQIIINPGEEAPEAPTLTEIKVSGMNINYVLGDELNLSDVVVKAYYSDNSVITLTDYTVDPSAVDKNVEGSYDVIFTYGGKTATITVNFEDPNADPAITESLRLDFTSPAGFEAIKSNKRITTPADETKFYSNGPNSRVEGVLSFMVKAGTEITVTPYTDSAYVCYSLCAEGEEGYQITSTDPYTYVADSDCTIVLTGYAGTNGNYLRYIDILVKQVYRENTTISLSGTEGISIQDAKGQYEGLEIDATAAGAKFASNGDWMQVNKDTIIRLNVLAGAEVSVVAYNSAANFTIETADGVCTITATANDYLKSITIKYPYVFKETTTVNLKATNGLSIEKTTGVYEGLEIDATNGKFADNGSGWTQVNQGTIVRLHVLEGAEVSLATYQDAVNYEIVIENGVCTITCTESGYWGSITVKYPIVYDKATTIDLSATGGLKIEGKVGVYEGLEIDATSGKFADNNGGYVQVNAGTIIKLQVADGAQVSVAAYNSAANFTVETADGVCTITCTAQDYLSAITIAY